MIVPVLFTLVVDKVIPFAMPLLLFSTKSPLPVTPPEIVSTALPLALLFVRVVPALFMFSTPLTVNAEVVEFSIIPVTFEPT